MRSTTFDGDWDPGTPRRPAAPPPPIPPGGGNMTLGVQLFHGAFTDNEWVYFRIGSEIMLGQWDSASSTFDTVYRGLFNTRVEQHDASEGWQEVAPIVGYDATGPLEVRYSKFTAGGTPLKLLLQLLVSGSATADTYNVLPDGWGAGFDPARVNLNSFKAAADAWGGWDDGEWDVCLIADGSATFSEWAAENLLKPFGFWLVGKQDDQLYCGSLSISAARPGLTPGTSTMRTLGTSEIVGTPKVGGDLDSIIGQLRVEGDAGASASVAVFTEPVKLYGVNWKTITVGGGAMWSREGIVGGPPGVRFAVMSRAFQRLRDYLQARYTRPAPVVELVTLYSAIDIEVGDFLTLNLPNLPGVDALVTGFNDVAEVLSRKVDHRTGTITFTMALLGYRFSRTNLACPGLYYTITGATLTPTTSGWVESGKALTDLFAANDWVMLYDVMLGSADGPYQISTVNATQIVLTSTPGMGWTDGFVTYAPYATATARQRAVGCWMSPQNGQLASAYPPNLWGVR